MAALSGVFTQAISDGHIPLGANPVSALLDKPAAAESTTELLESWQCAMLLESARTLPAAEADGRKPLTCAFEFLAFYLHGGSRRRGKARRDCRPALRPVPGLSDGVDPHPWHEDGRRRARYPDAPSSSRNPARVPSPNGASRRYLFVDSAADPIGDWRKTLDRIARRAGFADGEVRTRRFRVSYATHRCTCDGADVNTVRLEMGRTDLQMMAKVYARAQRRSERMGGEFSYRLDRWRHDVEAQILATLAA